MMAFVVTALVLACAHVALARSGTTPAPLVNQTLPSISGQTQDGQTLSADPGTWSGTAPYTYRYQWQRCTSTGCTNVTKATSSTYVAVSADVNNQITVIVTAVDATGATGKATATPVGPITAPSPPSPGTPAPAITGQPNDGQTLTAGHGAWNSPDVLTYKYQWQQCDNSGANCAPIVGAPVTSVLKLAARYVGADITVLVTATDKEGQSGQATATPVGPIGNPPPRSNQTLPQVSGTPSDGQTLTTTYGTWSSPDPLAYTRAWQRCDPSGTCTAIPGATAPTYTLTSVDVGDTVASVITAVDKEHQSTPATATAVGPVNPPPPPQNAAQPTLSGQPESGQTIGVNTGTWTSPDSLTYSYSWQRCDPSSGVCSTIDRQTTPYYTLTHGDVGMDIAATVTATDAEQQPGSATTMQFGPIRAAAPFQGIHKIQHVVVIMQENRSFDDYFGTFPGADGIPPNTCIRFGKGGVCAPSYHDTNDYDVGGPHGLAAGVADIDGGAMDGFANESMNNCGVKGATCVPCTSSAQSTCIDVMGYHDNREIPNYWAYARDFTLQDHMFEPVNSSSGPSHLYTVSAWSAKCTVGTDPRTCTSDPSNPPAPTYKGTYAWTDITYLLHQAGVSWGYYVQGGSEPDCANSNVTTCPPQPQSSAHPGIWNPLPGFTDVKSDQQLTNVQPIGNFMAAAQSGALPSVSWVVPSWTDSEHPAGGLISAGQSYVTGVINAIMHSPDWNRTAIFLSWDDWGGQYDNVVPPVIDSAGYGIRVPGLVISPYAKQGYIDHQTLSHDAYLKFIEDDFLRGQRLDPATDGRPDPRPDVRETASALGDLANDFDFTQQPAAPVILPTCPQTDLTPQPSC